MRKKFKVMVFFFFWETARMQSTLSLYVQLSKRKFDIRCQGASTRQANKAAKQLKRTATQTRCHYA